MMTRQQKELGVKLWKFDGGVEHIGLGKHVGREVSEDFGIESP